MWPAVPLGELCRTQSGGTPRRGEQAYYEGGIPWAKIGDLDCPNGVLLHTEESITSTGLAAIGNRLFSPGTILLAMYGSVGKTAVAGTSLATNQAILGITPVDTLRLDTRFLLRWLESAQGALIAAARGVAQANISKSIVDSIQIPLPPLSEQRRIAAVLDQAEALRAKRRAALAQLDTLTQAIFLEMFGDPATNPKKWRASTVGDELTFQQYGPRFYNVPYSDDGVRIVRITDLSESGELDFGAMPRMAVATDEFEKYALRPGDIIFARSGATVGKIAQIRAGDPPCIAGAYFITMRFTASIDPLYARFVLTAPSVREIVTRRSRQAAQQNFSGPGLRKLPMPLPPLALQQEFTRRVAAVETLKAAHRASLAHMDALFASLQHRAFRGEL